MLGPSGWWYLDGYDVWDNFGIMFNKGTGDFLKVPERKETIQHDWPDENGLDIDTTLMLFKERTIVIECTMIADTEAHFWENRGRLLAIIERTGVRRLVITAHKTRQYFVIYKGCTTPIKYGALNGDNNTKFVCYKMNITLLEPNPEVGADNGDIMTFLAADDGALIVT